MLLCFRSLRTVSDLKNLVESSKAYPKISFASLPSVRKVIQDATDWEKQLEKLTVVCRLTEIN